MAEETTLTIQVDEAVKVQATEVAASAGIELSTAVEMFLAEMIKTKHVPFVPTSQEKFPDIWNDDPKEIAAFNKSMGLIDDDSE
ncbi:type II toxin-antitoxin system RelB/DinJ family antitoxin [Lactiplantibacillus nangangensis]|uniref:Type II toxin-antitoxin system RelB/DinJ family antitoxin n=1 Tax=Lactiplantibacillus nangangensis TaxID=2559917 RepID=A0ABW1SF71_9LACO|nr:type II toxin-antitoxin system RelB/DinJ family antitoxin [Lactiplantibacillus nangangensis]